MGVGAAAGLLGRLCVSRQMADDISCDGAGRVLTEQQQPTRSHYAESSDSTRSHFSLYSKCFVCTDVQQEESRDRLDLDQCFCTWPLWYQYMLKLKWTPPPAVQLLIVALSDWQYLFVVVEFISPPLSRCPGRVNGISALAKGKCVANMHILLFIWT